MGNLDDFKSKYLNRLDEELGNAPTGAASVTTHQYLEFKQEYMPKHLSWYEKACSFSGRILKVSPGKKKIDKIKKAIEISHLEITPTDVTSFALLGPVIFVIIASFLGYAVPVFLSPLGEGSLFIFFFAMLAGLVMIYPLQKMPFFLANSWRMKASNQMVLCIFYIVTYMRHTSNYELAVDFAAEHLTPPLSLDMKKVIWDIETNKFGALKEAMNSYLKTWEEYNKEFIESMHLIESSLYENSESRRLDALDKALSVMLNETYEKMLHFAHNLKSPIQALHMLGIVLPILGLVILPLMVSFMPEVQWYHIMVIYNIALPIAVFYMGKNIMSTRPTGYGETKVDDETGYEKYKKVLLFKMGKSEFRVNPIWFAGGLFAVLLFLGILPLLLHAANPEYDWIFTDRGEIEAISGYQSENAVFYFLGYRQLVADGQVLKDVFIGPFGIGATLMSLFIPLAFGLGLGMFYRLRSKNLIKIRQQSKKLEDEFAAALFQLGNRLGDGVPAEIAFEKVSAVVGDSVSGKFFMLVSTNIRKLGMGLEQAIFDPHKGALAYYPSNLIESSMKVLVQASKKGPLVASQALINVSEYIKQMHRVDERLRDLMADIVSDMRSQISFLTPAIAGIVVGITSMITKILGSLSENISGLAADSTAAPGFGAGILGFFGTGMPTYWFQAIVGVYVVQVVFILTVLVNGIQSGSDKLMEQDLLGRYLTRTTIIYCVIAFIIMLLFNIIAGTIVQPFSSAVG